MRRMNYNPFEKPFASGKLSQSEGLHFTLDNPIEEGIYLFEIVENALDTPDEPFVQIGIIKYYETGSPSSEFYGQAYNYIITYVANKDSDDQTKKTLQVTLLNGYALDFATFSYTIKLYKVV